MTLRHTSMFAGLRLYDVPLGDATVRLDGRAGEGEHAALVHPAELGTVDANGQALVGYERRDGRWR